MTINQIIFLIHAKVAKSNLVYKLEMYVHGYLEEDGYLYVDVDTIKAGIRPSDYANALSKMEQELEKEGVEKVLLGCWHFENKLDVVLDEDCFQNQVNFLGFTVEERPPTIFKLIRDNKDNKPLKEHLEGAVRIDLSEKE